MYINFNMCKTVSLRWFFRVPSTYAGWEIRKLNNTLLSRGTENICNCLPIYSFPPDLLPPPPLTHTIRIKLTFSGSRDSSWKSLVKITAIASARPKDMTSKKVLKETWDFFREFRTPSFGWCKGRWTKDLFRGLQFNFIMVISDQVGSPQLIGSQLNKALQGNVIHQHWSLIFFFRVIYDVFWWLTDSC